MRTLLFHGRKNVYAYDTVGRVCMASTAIVSGGPASTDVDAHGARAHADAQTVYAGRDQVLALQRRDDVAADYLHVWVICLRTPTCTGEHKLKRRVLGTPACGFKRAALKGEGCGSDLDPLDHAVLECGVALTAVDHDDIYARLRRLRLVLNLRLVSTQWPLLRPARNQTAAAYVAYLGKRTHARLVVLARADGRTHQEAACTVRAL